MINLNYGNGSCSIEGDSRAVLIKYIGAINIIDKTSDNFVVNYNSNKIIIYPVGRGSLSDLFEYTGYLKIYYVESASSYAEKTIAEINPKFNHFNLMGNFNTITENIENLKSDYLKGNSVNKTLLINIEKPNQIIANEYLNKPKETSSVKASTPQISSSLSGSSGSSY